MHQPLDLSIQATNLMSRATLERKMEEVRNERLKVESFKNQADTLTREVASLEKRAEEFEKAADRLHLKGDDLARENILRLNNKIDDATLRIWQAQHANKESAAQQERCRTLAQEQRSLERQFRAEAESKRADATVRCGLSGEAGILGLTKNQMGWHNKARPYNETAAQLGEEAATLERKANKAEQRANEYKRETIRLLESIRTREDTIRQKERHNEQWAKKIESLNRKITATRQQVHDLKTEETRLRHEEGLLSDRASDLHELVQQSTVKAEQLELKIIGLEKQIPDINPTA